MGEWVSEPTASLWKAKASRVKLRQTCARATATGSALAASPLVPAALEPPARAIAREKRSAEIACPPLTPRAASAPLGNENNKQRLEKHANIVYAGAAAESQYSRKT